MSNDKQRIAAVRKLEQLGFTFAGDDWMHPTNSTSPTPAITDALHALLVQRADALEDVPHTLACKPGIDLGRRTHPCQRRILLAGSCHVRECLLVPRRKVTVAMR